jgi:hypothetical protein
MCMNCVAQSTPMITVGFGLLRRQALKAWIAARLERVRPSRDRGPTVGAGTGL